MSGAIGETPQEQYNMSYQFYNNWPYSYSVFPTMQDNVDPVNNEYFTGLHQEIINIENFLGLHPEGTWGDLGGRVTDIETELGTDPQGAFDTVVLRLNDVDSSITDLISREYFYHADLFSLPSASAPVLTNVEGSLAWFKVLVHTYGSEIKSFLDIAIKHKLAGINKRITVYYYGTATGDVQFYHAFFKRSVGGNFLTGYSTIATGTDILTFAGGDVNIMKTISFVIASADFSDNDYLTIAIYRQGNSGADTMDGDWNVIGVLVSDEPA
jgi:hypothetical protein